MIQKILPKVDDVVAFIALTLMFFFPIVRFLAALGGEVLIGFDTIMAVLAAGYFVWLVWSDVLPAVRKSDPGEITPLRWLAAFFILPWAVPYFRVDMSTYGENAVATSALVVGLVYAIGVYIWDVRWPFKYVLMLVDYANIVKAHTQPLVLDILKNNKKPEQAENPFAKGKTPQTKEQSVPVAPKPRPATPASMPRTVNGRLWTPFSDEKKADTPATGSNLSPLAASMVAKPTTSSSKLNPFGSVSEPWGEEKGEDKETPVVEALEKSAEEAGFQVADQQVATNGRRAVVFQSLASVKTEDANRAGDEKAIEKFAEEVKTRGSAVNTAAYKLKSGTYSNFTLFNTLVREDPAEAYKVFMGWLGENRADEYRADVMAALQ